jgi:hypothetical protein
MDDTWLIDGPTRAQATFVFAHGAGAPMDSPFMDQIAQGLAAQGVRVVRFEFPYMAERRSTGKRKGPGPATRLIPVFEDVVRRVRSREPLFVGGKSMGGRIATHVADVVGARGVICLGYPFHPPGKPSSLRLENLQALKAPCLIAQGTRDSMGTREDVAGYTLPAHVQVHWLEDGDHSLKPRKKSGFSEAEHLAQAVRWAAAFIEEHRA